MTGRRAERFKARGSKPPPSSSIVGNIEYKGPAQVFGRIEGELRASDLLISDGAQVEGNVIATWPRRRYRPSTPSWRMGRSTRLRTDFATQADVAHSWGPRIVCGFEREAVLVLLG